MKTNKTFPQTFIETAREVFNTIFGIESPSKNAMNSGALLHRKFMESYEAGQIEERKHQRMAAELRRRKARAIPAWLKWPLLVFGIWAGIMALLRFFFQIDFKFCWFDFWAGFYYSRYERVFYHCPIPMFLFRFSKRVKQPVDDDRDDQGYYEGAE